MCKVNTNLIKCNNFVIPKERQRIKLVDNRVSAIGSRTANETKESRDCTYCANGSAVLSRIQALHFLLNLAAWLLRDTTVLGKQQHVYRKM